MKTYYWVAKICKKYGYAYELIDGPHDTEESAAVGLYLHQTMFHKENIGVVKVEQLDTKPSKEGVDKGAVDICSEALDQYLSSHYK